MSSQDWKNQLSNLITNDPDLQVPEQYIISEETKEIKKQNLLIQFEKKGRNGKQVTIISGFDGSEKELKELASELKRTCGVGGSARGKEILIQGDFREKLVTILNGMGHKTKRAN
jgi:translation initiation factor 1